MISFVICSMGIMQSILVGESLRNFSRSWVTKLADSDLEALLNSPYFALMVDETTDISVVKQMILSVCYI